jgi:hypothetical protein
VKSIFLEWIFSSRLIILGKRDIRWCIKIYLFIIVAFREEKMNDLSVGNIFSILFGALISWITIWLKEFISSQSQVKLERLKL